MNSPNQARPRSTPCAVTTKPGFKTNVPLNCCGRATPAKKTGFKLYVTQPGLFTRSSN